MRWVKKILAEALNGPQILWSIGRSDMYNNKWHGLFSKILQFFQECPSHRILRYTHVVLNIKK